MKSLENADFKDDSIHDLLDLLSYTKLSFFTKEYSQRAFDKIFGIANQQQLFHKSALTELLSTVMNVNDENMALTLVECIKKIDGNEEKLIDTAVFNNVIATAVHDDNAVLLNAVFSLFKNNHEDLEKILDAAKQYIKFNSNKDSAVSCMMRDDYQQDMDFKVTDTVNFFEGNNLDSDNYGIYPFIFHFWKKSQFDNCEESSGYEFSNVRVVKKREEEPNRTEFQRLLDRKILEIDVRERSLRSYNAISSPEQKRKKHCNKSVKKREAPDRNGNNSQYNKKRALNDIRTEVVNEASQPPSYMRNLQTTVETKREKKPSYLKF